MLIASSAAAAIDASVNAFPRNESSAARALSGVGPTLVSAMATSPTVAPFMRNVTAAAAVAKSPTLRFSLA